MTKLDASLQNSSYHNTAVIQLAATEVNEHSHSSTGSFEVIDDLTTLVVGQQVAESFDFDHYLTINEQVQMKQANLLASVQNVDRVLIFDRHLLGTQLTAESSYVGLPGAAWAKFMMHVLGGADDLVREDIIEAVIDQPWHNVDSCEA